MKPVEVSVEIGRPADEVFEYLEDATNNPHWIKNMDSCTWTSTGPIGVGSTYDQRSHFLGRTIEVHFRVTAHEPGRLITITSAEGSSFPITVTREVTPVGPKRCRVKETVQGDPEGFYRMASPLLRLGVIRNVRRDYAELKAMMEAR